VLEHRCVGAAAGDRSHDPVGRTAGRLQVRPTAIKRQTGGEPGVPILESGDGGWLTRADDRPVREVAALHQPADGGDIPASLPVEAQHHVCIAEEFQRRLDPEHLAAGDPAKVGEQKIN